MLPKTLKHLLMAAVPFVLLLSSFFVLDFSFLKIMTNGQTAPEASKGQTLGHSKVDDYDAIWNEKLRLMSQFFNVTETDRKLFQNVASIQKSCGQVCDTSIKGVPGKYYEHIRKKVDCDGLFTNEYIDYYSEYETAPKDIPTYMLPEFTHNGRWRVISDYRDESQSGKSHEIHWTVYHVSGQVDLFNEGKMPGSYGERYVQAISEHLDKYGNIKGKHGLVIGSQTPWLEGILLAKGAAKVTTFDYIKIKCDHPQVETMTPKGLAQKYFDGIRFDFMVTFSSVEHSGLGRYGDMINPWGDLITMARSWCLVKPDGYGLVGVPFGPDVIGFNSHKIYGPLGLAQLFANWEHLYTDADMKNHNETHCYYCYQPPHSLRRI